MDEDIRNLATLVTEIIRRMGANYGLADEWRRDITAAVQIMERANVRIVKP